MTPKDKQLLIKDLCARLPYGVQILYDSDKKFNNGLICQPCGLTKYDGRTCIHAFGFVGPIEIDELKLCLRPMSSMTDEERKEYEATCDWYETLETYDWLNENHFDYRGLIERGLAIEATEGMYD